MRKFFLAPRLEISICVGLVSRSLFKPMFDLRFRWKVLQQPNLHINVFVYISGPIFSVFLAASGPAFLIFAALEAGLTMNGFSGSIWIQNSLVAGGKSHAIPGL